MPDTTYRQLKGVQNLGESIDYASDLPEVIDASDSDEDSVIEE